jgi:hypothetical protein
LWRGLPLTFLALLFWLPSSATSRIKAAGIRSSSTRHWMGINAG